MACRGITTQLIWFIMKYCYTMHEFTRTGGISTTLIFGTIRHRYPTLELPSVQSPKLIDMYQKPQSTTDQVGVDSEKEDMDIMKIFKDIEHLGSLDMAGKADALKRTLQVSNLNPLLTVDQLKQLFSFCGTVVECSITDSRHSAYIEYSKPEEATAALVTDDIDVGGRPMNVAMAKSLPSKLALSNTSLPMMMQQAVAMQQMQFQQALVMQQTLVSQQAATHAATMKSSTVMASARAAEISKNIKEDGLGLEDNDEGDKRKSRMG